MTFTGWSGESNSRCASEASCGVRLRPKRKRSTFSLLGLLLFLRLRLADELRLGCRFRHHRHTLDRSWLDMLRRRDHADRGVFLVEHRDALGEHDVADVQAVAD